MNRLLILLSILISFTLQAQQIIPLNEKPYLDSLKNIVNTKTNTQSIAESAFLLSNYYRNTDSPLSKKYLEQGKNLNQKNPYLLAKYFYFEGQYNLDRDKEKAAVSYQRSIKELSKFKTEESAFLQALAWYSYGVTQKDKEGYPFLLKIILEKSIPLVERYENNKSLGFLYTQLAIILTYNAEFEKAGNYNKKALMILERSCPHSAELFYTYLNSASNFC